MKVLYKSADIRKEIIRLFSDPNRRRVAIAAFVGDGAETYLPKPKGLQLICWPKAGGTNPNVLRKLWKQGAQISFADSLHMKVYWSQGKGAIITSANLSTNALGAGSLKEIGLLMPSVSLNIDRVITSLRTRPITSTELNKLHRVHKLFQVKNPRMFSNTSHLSFKQWYKTPGKEEWKLGWWRSPALRFSSHAMTVVKEEYEIAEPHWSQACNRREFRKGDWMLSFRLTEKGASEATWMFVDFIAELTKSELKLSGYPCDAIQVWPPNRYPERPFRIDKQFRTAFSKAIREFGKEKIEKAKSSKPSARLLDLIYNRYT